MEKVYSFEKVLPIKWLSWDMCGEYGDICFWDVEFTEDFGVIKKGETFDKLNLFQHNGKIELYNTSLVHTIDIKYQPIES